jgi:hypothetical protein
VRELLSLPLYSVPVVKTRDLSDPLAWKVYGLYHLVHGKARVRRGVFVEAFENFVEGDPATAGVAISRC